MPYYEDTDAPDVLQETFLQVYRNLPSFRGESQFGTWLYRIATNAALMHRRPARGVQATRSNRSFRDSTQREDTRRPPPNSRSLRAPKKLSIGRSSPQRLATASRGCPNCIGLRSCCAISRGSATADVARMLGVEPATVRQRVHRARLMLRGYLAHLVGVQP